MTEGELTHLDAQGRARMVDVTDKPDADRTAVAEGWVRMQPSTLERIRRQDMAKGDVLGVSRLAGIMGAKQTPQLVPLCHPILTTGIQVDLSLVEPDVVRVEASVRSAGRTGPEMEALTAVSCACLTLYDMCKGVDRTLEIGGIRLLEKTGGKSGHWKRAD